MRRMFDDIRKKLDGYSEPAPEGLWDRIETAFPRQGSRVTAGRLWRIAAAVTAAAAVITAGVLLIPRTEVSVTEPPVLISDGDMENTGTVQNRPASTQSTPPVSRQTETVSGLTAEYIPEEQEPPRMADARNDINYIYDKNAGLNNPGQNGSVQETAEEDMTTKEIRVHEKVVTDNDEHGAGTEGIDNRLSGNGAGRDEGTGGGKELSAESEEIKSRGLFSIGLSVSNSPGSSSREHGYTSLSGNSARPIPATASYGGLWIDPEANMRMLNSNEEVNSDTRYRLPVRTGLTLRYLLPSRLGIETGIMYSWLSSTFQSGSENSYYISTREMHYIGVPLNISYTFLESRFLSIYITAGGLMEKCVGGTDETGYILSGESFGSTSREPLSTKPLQWSVNATVGAQLNFTPAIGLYVEPGAAYFFNDGTDLRTIYKARPFDFYLRFGLRFSFGL